ncbi:hypothetical protein GCM10010191_89270 [Actinomadura vinacea]|uniref:Sigma-70 family RNA polymerase sigma factor n=1 Tax=Actinomadura vinacea TaxID=115336 RepID=A0ABN3KD19_9ACTN
MTHDNNADGAAGNACVGDRPGNALAVAERTFQLLIAGPCPLALDGRKVGHGQPARAVDLGELREALLAPAATDTLKDAVWAELVTRARTKDPAWVIGCVGVAMPGLKNVAARVLRSSPERLADDIVSELLTEFVAQLHGIDITRPHIAARLMLWARKGALRARARESRHLACTPEEMPSCPSGQDSDPVDLLLRAARQEIITPDMASLIIATRLDGVCLTDIAQDRGIAPSRLYRRRMNAEARLAAAIHAGDLSPTSDRIST